MTGGTDNTVTVRQLIDGLERFIGMDSSVADLPVAFSAVGTGSEWSAYLLSGEMPSVQNRSKKAGRVLLLSIGEEM